VPTLRLPSGEAIKTADALAGKTHVLLYFSAHWCGPCRMFTPQLAAAYADLKKAQPHAEVIFVSADQEEDEFNEYHATMPWPAIPYAKASSGVSFNAAIDDGIKGATRGIPSLVVAAADGSKLVCTDGRSAFSDDKQFAKFPWATPDNVFEVLAGATFIPSSHKDASADAATSVADLQGKKKHFALYFSAHWCGPCRGFTPKLASLYGAVAAAGGEVIFCTSDRDEEGFKGYHAEMPWPALPFGDARIATLKRMLQVRGIPTLVTFAADGTIVNKDARGVCDEDEDGSQWPWAPMPLPRSWEISTNFKSWTGEVIEQRVNIVCHLAGFPKDSAEAAAALAQFKAVTAGIADVAGASAPFAFAWTGGAPPPPKAGECPDGHPTELRTGLRSNRCDVCRKGCESSHRCDACDYDQCTECADAGRTPAPPAYGLLGRILSAAGRGDEPLPAPAGKAVVMGWCLKGAKRHATMDGEFTADNIVAFANKFATP